MLSKGHASAVTAFNHCYSVNALKEAPGYVTPAAAPGLVPRDIAWLRTLHALPQLQAPEKLYQLEGAESGEVATN